MAAPTRVPAQGYIAGCVPSATAVGVPTTVNTVPAAAPAFAVLEYDGPEPEPKRRCPEFNKRGGPCGGWATASGVCSGHTKARLAAAEGPQQGRR